MTLIGRFVAACTAAATALALATAPGRGHPRRRCVRGYVRRQPPVPLERPGRRQGSGQSARLGDLRLVARRGEGATVYGGTSPGGRVFGYDPATGVRDYGRLSPDHAYVRSVSYANGKIYAGTEAPAAIFEIDAASGAVKRLPAPPEDVTGKWAYDVNAWGGYLYVRLGGASPGSMHVWDIAAGAWVDRLDSAHGLDVSPPDDEGRVYLVKSGELVRYDPRTKAVTPTGLPITGRVANTRGIGYAELGAA